MEKGLEGGLENSPKSFSERVCFFGGEASLAGMLKEKYPFGKYLVLTDEKNALAVTAALKRLPDKYVCVLKEEEDVLPLFLLPEVTCAVGVGKAAGAARYFAAVRGISCGAVALEGYGRDLICAHADVCISGGRVRYPVPPPDWVFVDFPSINARKEEIFYLESYLAACALSVFSFDAAVALDLPFSETENAENIKNTENMQNTAASLRDKLSAVCGAAGEERDVKELFKSAAEAENCFSQGFPQGEIFAFIEVAERLLQGGREAITANCVQSLAEVYRLFFECGFYRNGGADYNERLRAAINRAAEINAATGGRKIEVKAPQIPSSEKLQKCVCAFEKEKGKFSEKISEFLKGWEKIKEAAKNAGMGGADLSADLSADFNKLSEILRLLPEFSPAPYGILSLMREFSLL